MPAFQIIKRSDVPASRSIRHEAGGPSARIHKSGQIFFSTRAAEILGKHPLLVVEFDSGTCYLKLTAVDKPPRGLTAEDCFPLRIAKHHVSFTPVALFRYIGFQRKPKESQAIEVVEADPARHSLTLLLPAEQMRDPAEVHLEGAAVGANLEGYARPARA